MTSLATRPAAPTPTRVKRGLRERLARLERPLLLAGLALVALHLLDLAFSGPDTSLPGVLAIVAVPAAWALAQPHVTRPTRLVLGVVIGLLSLGFGVVSHGLHVVNSGPDWADVTGVGMIAGGLLLVAARPHRDRRPAAPAPPPRARLAARPRSRLARRRPRLRPARRDAVRDGADGDACPALGDPGVLARHPAPGGDDRNRGRRADRVVRPVTQSHGRAAQPRLGRQPRAPGRARAHARPPRLRRARVRQPRQRRERRPLQRPRLQRAAGRRRRDATG